MSEGDSLIRAILGGLGATPSAGVDHTQGQNQLLINRELLKSCCQAKPLGWLILFGAALTTVLACLFCGKTNESSTQPSTTKFPESAAEMAMFLRERLPRARIVSTREDGQIDRSFLLTLRDWDENTLRKMPRVSDRAEQWRGTVLCEWLVDWQPAELFLEEWGEHGLALPPFVFFGDKELLAQIKGELQ